MKKEYIKPSIIIENFEVNEFIAGACAEQGRSPIDITTIINSTLEGCMLDDGSGTFMFSSYCLDNGGINGMIDNVDACYQGIMGLHFNS